jgi:hypothetical protein
MDADSTMTAPSDANHAGRFMTCANGPAERSWIWFTLLQAFALIAGLVVHRRLPLQMGLSEYGKPALEFYHTHHISSVFSSPGYAAIIGSGMVLFGETTGLIFANMVIYLVYVAVVWTILRQLGASARQAAILGAAFALYPDILFSINRVYHSILSPLLLLMYIAAAIYLIRSRNAYRADVLMAVVLGFDFFCRSNVILLFAVTWFLLCKYKLPRAALRAAVQAVGSVTLFSALCVAVHGSVFWPTVGAYVLFSGANEYTQSELLSRYDETAESSIIPALKLRGISAYGRWEEPDNIPGDHEVRNPMFTRTYSHEAMKFIVGHPWTMVKLTGVKLYTLLRPDLWTYRALSVGGVIKILATLAIPLWVVLCLMYPQPTGDPSRWIVGLTLLAFVVPLLLSVTAPRNRVSMDVICFLDSAGILVLHHRSRRNARQRAS